MPIDVSELMNDPDFCFDYRVHRSRYEWRDGRPERVSSEILNFYGPVQSAAARELEQFPEGDRQKGIKKFFCTPPETLHMTGDNPEAGLQENEFIMSDMVEYDGQFYKIISVASWKGHGYIRAFGYSVGMVNPNG